MISACILSIKEENGILFKRCIRKLLSSTFILRDKDEKLYAFAARESNRQDISEYLRMIALMSWSKTRAAYACFA